MDRQQDVEGISKFATEPGVAITTVSVDEPPYARAFAKYAKDKIPEDNLANANLIGVETMGESQEVRPDLVADYKKLTELNSLISKGKAGLLENGVVRDDLASYIKSIRKLLPWGKEYYIPLKISIDNEKREKEVESVVANPLFEQIKKVGNEARGDAGTYDEIASDEKMVVDNVDLEELGFVKALKPLVTGEATLFNLDDDQFVGVQKALTILLALTKNFSGEPGATPKLTMEAAGRDIIIDPKKRAEAVKEVTENPFFNDLVAKARELRKRNANTQNVPAQ